MSDELRQILRRHSTSIAAHLAAELVKGSESRFQKIDSEVLSERCAMLVEALVASAWQGADQLAQRVTMIAQQRFKEGFLLEDLQQALRILEVDAWRIIANESGQDSVVTNLGTLTIAMGYARDELARIAQLYAFAPAS
ncbi:MAG: hypothetical protein LJF30_12470 [Acidobacteria bacterium]|jgi:hypothetical protein|nr:hypothetical protein [Acidobacteriota bacterium]